MSPAEIQLKINIAQREADFWRGILKRKGCRDCAQWMYPGCGLAEGNEPPAEVIKVGCDAWKWDGITF